MEAFDETFAVKTGLKTIIPGKAIRAAVDRAVLDMTQLRWETMQLANLWVLRRIQSGQAVPRLTQSVFYQAMQLVLVSSSGRTPAKPVEGLLEALEELYKPERAPSHPHGQPPHEDAAAEGRRTGVGGGRIQSVHNQFGLSVS